MFKAQNIQERFCGLVVSSLADDQGWQVEEILGKLSSCDNTAGLSQRW